MTVGHSFVVAVAAVVMSDYTVEAARLAEDSIAAVAVADYNSAAVHIHHHKDSLAVADDRNNSFTKAGRGGIYGV